jgi:hypothetical protein
MLTRSGPQGLKADFTVEPEGEGFTLVQSNLTTNGRPNRLSAEYVLAHYDPSTYVEMRGDTLRVYVDDKSRERFFSLVPAPS